MRIENIYVSQCCESTNGMILSFHPPVKSQNFRKASVILQAILRAYTKLRKATDS
jgi:hypothetical protein